MYNFNAKVGDSWEIKLIDDSIAVATVEEIDSVMVDGVYLTRQIVSFLVDGNLYDWGYGNAIEKLGGTIFLSPLNTFLIEIGEKHILLNCYEDDTFSSVDSSHQWGCAMLTSVFSKEKVEPELSVFPNPAIHSLTIQFPANLNGMDLQAKILDIFGRAVVELPSFNDSRLSQTVDISDLKKGVYFLVIEQDNRYISAKKILKK